MRRTKLSQPHELFNASGRDVLRCIIDDGDPDGEVTVSTTGGGRSRGLVACSPSTPDGA